MTVSLVLDFIIVAIVAVCTVFSAKRGFVRTFVEIAGIILVIVSVYSFSTPAAKFVYNTVVEPAVVKSAETTAGKAASLTADGVWNAFPKLVTGNAERFGIDREEVLSKIETKTSEGVSTATKSAADILVRPIVTKLLASLIAIVGILILIPLVKWLSKFINKVFSISLVGKANKILGGVFGFIKGICFASAFCLVVALILLFSSGKFTALYNGIENSTVFKFIYDLIPFT